MSRDAQGKGQESSLQGTSSGEFTQLFSALQKEPPPQSPAETVSAAESPQETEAEATGDAAVPQAGGFTAMFGSLQQSPASEGGALSAIQPAERQHPAPGVSPNPMPASEAPTAVFPSIQQSAAPLHPASATDETRIFAPAVAVTQALQPQLAAEPVPHPAATVPAALTESARTPGVFAEHLASVTPTTRTVVTPEAGFLAPPPAVTPAAQRGCSSDFTQIFQPIAAPPAWSQPSVAQAPPANASGEFTQFFSAISARESEASKLAVPPASPTSPLPPAPQPSVPQAASPSEFTRLFGAPATPQKDVGASSAPPATSTFPAAGQADRSAAQPGAFTQMFSQLAPPPAAATAPSAPLAPPPVPAPVSPSASPAADPIFGAPAPRGSFTDIFVAQPAQVSSAPIAGGFTELFRPTVLPHSTAAPLPLASGAVSSAFATPLTPATAPQAAGGEFTRLMQSLERGGATPAPAVAVVPVDAAFFSAGPASSAGESEYTRVMRGGAAQPGRGAPAGAPAAGSAAAPGLALAPAPAADASADRSAKDKPAKEKPKTLVILLVVMNVVLLLALLVIGLVLLRHK